DVSEARPEPKVGDKVNFRMSYGALLAAMTSEYVEKVPMYDRHTAGPASRVSIFAEETIFPVLNKHGLDGRLANIGYDVDLTPEITVDRIPRALDRGAPRLPLGRRHPP